MTSSGVARVDPLVQRLKAVAEAAPHLKEAALVYGAILTCVRDTDLHLTSFSITAGQARAAMEAGRPLLEVTELELDVMAVRDLMIDVAQAIDAVADEEGVDEGSNVRRIGAAAGRVRLALQRDQVDVDDLISSVAAGVKSRAAAIAHSLDLDNGILWSIAQNALRPTLISSREKLAPLVEGLPWNGGFCFICGAGAAVGELRENHQERHLRCRQCGASWQVRRLQCPWCGNEDHRTLHHLYTADQAEGVRLEVCEKCKGYLKVITTFAPTPAEMLPVEDLATLYLDYIALERGYKRVPFRQSSS
jgi:FdhE protein